MNPKDADMIWEILTPDQRECAMLSLPDGRHGTSHPRGMAHEMPRGDRRW